MNINDVLYKFKPKVPRPPKRSLIDLSFFCVKKRRKTFVCTINYEVSEVPMGILATSSFAYTTTVVSGMFQISLSAHLSCTRPSSRRRPNALNADSCKTTYHFHIVVKLPWNTTYSFAAVFPDSQDAYVNVNPVSAAA